MKILMQNRADLYTKPGGDLIQMEKTKQELEKLGVHVDISTDITPNLSTYDAVHLFNITRIHETVLQAHNAKKQKKPIILSPIYHIQEEIDLYEKLGRTGPIKLLSQMGLTNQLKEQMKAMYRGLQDPQQLQAASYLLMKGFFRSQKETVAISDILCVLAESEALQIEKDFSISKPFVITPNGVDVHDVASITALPSEIQHLKDFILCVGRIEDRKNQLNLIKALKGTNTPLILVGAPNANHRQYVNQVMRMIHERKDIYYYPSLPHNQVLTLNKLATVSVSVSWFEVLSLAVLEAAMMGANIVTTDVGYIKEYLQENAWYCHPNDIQSIQKSISRAYNTPKSDKLKNSLKKYTWEYAAKQVLSAYKKALQ